MHACRYLVLQHACMRACMHACMHGGIWCLCMHLLRSLVIVIDATDGMRETDFKPDRLTCATQMLEVGFRV